MKINTLLNVRYKDLQIIIDNMFNLYKSGIPIFNSFELMEELPLSKEYKGSIKGIKEELNKGESLHYAFAQYDRLYPKFFLSMLKVGEETGRLGDVLKGLDLYYKKVNLMKRRLKSSLTYPAILVLASLFLVVFFGLFVIPTFQDIFISMEKEVPKVIEIFIRIKIFIDKSPFVSVIFLCFWGVIIPSIIIFYNKERVMTIIYKVPLIKRFREYVSIVLLSIIIKSGISLSTGLEQCMDIDLLGGVKEQFSNVNLLILEGKALNVALEKTSGFSKYTLAHIKLGEECGNLEGILNNLEKELFDKLNLELNRILELIQPITIVFIGGLVMSFILIVILPVFEGLIG